LSLSVKSVKIARNHLLREKAEAAVVGLVEKVVRDKIADLVVTEKILVQENVLITAVGRQQDNLLMQKSRHPLLKELRRILKVVSLLVNSDVEGILPKELVVKRGIMFAVGETILALEKIVMGLLRNILLLMESRRVVVIPLPMLEKNLMRMQEQNPLINQRQALVKK
jgi:hypothetical protein